MSKLSKQRTVPSEEEIAEKRAARARKRDRVGEFAEDDEGFVSAHKLEYKFSKHVIEVEEDWSGDGSALAGMQWLGGVTLARYFDNSSFFPVGSFDGKRILEVGAGVGMTSILLALMGANVTLTDLDLEKSQPNIAANLTDPVARARLTSAKLDWAAPDLDRFDLPYDIIIAGDCFYVPDVVEPLLHTMWHMSSAETHIYMCGIVSDAALAQFNSVINTYFDVERLSLEEFQIVALPLNSDDPKTRYRALMRLHRLPLIREGAETEADPPMLVQDAMALDGYPARVGNILWGPEMIGELEVHACRCPRLMYRELTHVFPGLKSPFESIITIPTNQHSAMDLVKIGNKVELEKDRCLEVFMEFGKQLCTALRNQGFWADYIDPCSGLPMLTPNTTKIYSEVESMQTLLHYRTMNAGMCKVLLHPKWGSAVYPATAFTDAPLDDVAKVIAQLQNSGAPGV